MKKVGYFIVVGILIFLLLCLTYFTATYKAEIKALTIDKDFCKAKQKEAEKLAEQYFSQALFYVSLLRSGYIISEDGEYPLKKGSLVIPAEVFEKLKKDMENAK